MFLTGFIESLASHGAVSVAGEITVFTEADRTCAASMLGVMHQSDASHLAATAPAFHAPAALWAAELLYRAIQCNFLRHLTHDEVIGLLPDYDGERNAAAIYSADLMLRHLPDLFRLTRHLAPTDVMVPRLQALAAAWPLSSVGLLLPEVPAAGWVMEHPSLRMLYIDRIIDARDVRRCNDPAVRSAVAAALGGLEDVYWPGFSLQS